MKPDWSKTDLTVVQEIIREAELYLQAQVALATSADQRASSMASLFTAAGAAIIAGLFAVAVADHPAGTIALYVGGGLAATLFFVAAILTIWSAWPVEIKVPGNVPASWYGDLDGQRDFRTLLAEQAEVYQDMIDGNNDILSANAQRLAWGAASGIAAAPFGAIAWLLAFILA